MHTTKTRKPKASKGKNNGSACQPSFLRARRGELQYDIVGDPLIGLSFDDGDSSELSEWCATLIDDADDRGAWDLAAEVLMAGYKIVVRVSPGNSVRVAAMIASRLAVPVIAGFQTETETLAFWAQKNKQVLAEERGLCDCHDAADVFCRRCGTAQ